MTDNHSRHDFVVADRVRLCFESGGFGDPVILLHAGVTEMRMWDDQFADFGARHTVVRFDARGFGRSDAASGVYSPRADIVAVMSALG
jgi:pimeloyl-ACP methyl ester carboxylesterase